MLAERDPDCDLGLRRAKPVERITPDVTHWFATRRQIAVMALGDTADSAALPPVIGRLRDQRWWAGAGVPVESAADALTPCLQHDRQEVIEQVAGALALPSLRERLLWSRVTLMPLWPGEE